MVKPTVKISINFPREDYAALKALCIQRGLSITQVGRDALMEIKDRWFQEELQKDEDIPHNAEKKKERVYEV